MVLKVRFCLFWTPFMGWKLQLKMNLVLPFICFHWKVQWCKYEHHIILGWKARAGLQVRNRARKQRSNYLDGKKTRARNHQSSRRKQVEYNSLNLCFVFDQTPNQISFAHRKTHLTDSLIMVGTLSRFCPPKRHNTKVASLTDTFKMKFAVM